MNINTLIKLGKKIIDYLILNHTLLKAYFSNYSNETIFSLADKLIKGFIKQEATTLFQVYIENYIAKKTKGISGFFSKCKARLVNTFCTT